MPEYNINPNIGTKLKTPEQFGTSSDITPSTSVEERKIGIIQRYKESSQKAREEGIATMDEGTLQRMTADTKKEKTTGFLKEMQGVTEGTAGTVIAGIGAAASPLISGIAKIGEEMGEGFKSGLSAIVPDAIENPIKMKALEGIAKAAEGGKFLVDKLDPETKELIKQSGLTAFQLLDFIPFVEAPAIARGVASGIETAVKTTQKVPMYFEQIGTKVNSMFEGALETVDDVIKQSDEAIKTEAGQLRATAEATAPELSVTEKWAGIRPDIKRRIEGKADKLQEYFDIAHARNLDDRVATPLEWGAKNVEAARDTMKGMLDDTGSEIGRFRTEVAEATIPSARAGTEIRNTFVDEMNKLNLTFGGKDGKTIIQMPNKVKKASASEIKLLNSLYEDMLKVREKPTMQNLIDLRDAFGSQVNFSKTAGEASNVVDPLSRAVRAKIKEINAAAVGPEQAALLDKYSNTIEALSELNKYVDSRSGAEFLLKRVLSERGRMPRELFDTIKEMTGIDLMDDAVMAQLATEIIGNSAQKGLFQQEITKAGLNVTDILAITKGKLPVGFIGTLMEKGKEAIAPVEETFLKAARKKGVEPQVKSGIENIKSSFKKGETP